MKLADLPTPCLVLDRTILERNIRAMAAALSRLGVPLRPHMKTAKCIEVARLATAGQPGGITVSTLAEAEYFFGHGITDILYAVGITPQKLEQVVQAERRGRAHHRDHRRSGDGRPHRRAAGAAADPDRDRQRRGTRRRRTRTATRCWTSRARLGRAWPA